MDGDSLFHGSSGDFHEKRVPCHAGEPFLAGNHAPTTGHVSSNDAIGESVRPRVA